MNQRVSISILIIMLIFIFFISSCSEKITPPETNEPPQIAFTFEKIAVAKNAGTVELTVSISDPDGDPLTVTWNVTRGVLDPGDQGTPQMTWTVPDTVGVDTVRVSVSDGKTSRSIMETIVVGFPWSANITNDTTWRTQTSPYVIKGLGSPPRLAVPYPSTLYIEPGVTIYVPRDFTFDVTGTLNTYGTEVNPVVFQINNRTPESGLWEGILVSTDPGGAPPGQIDLLNTWISYGVQNIKITSGASAKLDGCHLHFSRNEAVLHLSSGILDMANCAVTNNRGDGIKVSGITTKPESLIIHNNEISINDGVGVVLDFPDTSGVVPVDISGNEIIWNNSHGIYLARVVYPEINMNAIYANDMTKPDPSSRWNLLLEPGFLGDLLQIDATNNYWLTTDSLVIEQMIYDSRDNASINTRVRFWPWLTSWP